MQDKQKLRHKSNFYYQTKNFELFQTENISFVVSWHFCFPLISVLEFIATLDFIADIGPIWKLQWWWYHIHLNWNIFLTTFGRTVQKGTIFRLWSMKMWQPLHTYFLLDTWHNVFFNMSIQLNRRLKEQYFIKIC